MGVQIQFFTGVQENFDKLVENEKLAVGSLYFIKDECNINAENLIKIDSNAE